MKKKPQMGQKVWDLTFDKWVNFLTEIKVRACEYNGWNQRFNCFSTSREAEEARRKIVRILKGK